MQIYIPPILVEDWLRILRYVLVVVQFLGIFCSFDCVILPPILVEVLAPHFAVTISLLFGF